MNVSGINPHKLTKFFCLVSLLLPMAGTAWAALPPGWSDADIGSPGLAGSASYANALWTVIGGGADIWGTADQFNFASTNFTGDGTMMVRVTSLQNSDPGSGWSKAGLMFRNDSTAGSANVSIVATAVQGVSLQWRSAAGGSSSYSAQSGITAPVWLKLARSGSSFTGYYSTDGSNWTLVGGQSVLLNNTVMAGFDVTAHNNSALNTATFTNFSLVPTANSISTPLPVPTYGWNLGNSLEAIWGYSYPSQALFNAAAAAGFNAVRIPCAWDFNATTNITANATNYPINATYMAHVKQAVDYALAAGMYVVINDHWDDGWLENNIGISVSPTINAKMNAYWTQIATTFAGYDNHLLFAAANEPNVSSPAAMTTLMVYYQTFVNAVRGVGGYNTNRWLVLQGGGDTSWLNSLPADPTPNRLMVEYHNYTPSLFTIIHTDQSWGTAIYFWGPAYHYSGDPTRNATWGEEGWIDSGFQQLTDQYVSKGIPVMVGEFQAGATGGLPAEEALYNRDSTLYWNKYVAESARAHGLSPFYWSTVGSPFNWTSGAVTDPQVITALTGGTVPPPPTNGAPYAASNLTATNTGTGQISLSWTAGSGATSYNLYRAAESGYESPIAPVVTGITGTFYTDTGLNSGTTYYYQVVAVSSSGPSGFSPEAHAPIPGVNADPAQFNFETDPQHWTAGGSPIAGVATSSAQHFAGKQSLAVNFNGTAAGSSSVSVGNMGGSLALAAGTTITFHVWIPSGSKVTSLQPYLQDYNWAWTSSSYGNLTAGAWNTITVTVPPTATTPVQALGIQFTTSAAWSGTCYIDSVAWNIVLPGNTPPTLAPIADQTVNVGQTVAFTASANDTDQPPQTLAFSLLSGPTNASINASSGAFSFRPLVSQANTTNPISLEVTDSGTPPMSATQSFTVTVNPLTQPQFSSAGWSNGQFVIQVSGQSGPDYEIQTTTNLTQWNAVFTTNTPVMPFSWQDPAATNAAGFYRVVVGPPLP
ncbi:MAG TPA: cellulase family glycosylhydrolase [Verrucomicrobiae bacterium]|nr:cellulase family glycosylhydrolase [Verrucomicrobiae bacterium]